MRIGIHAQEQAAKKGFPEAVIRAIISDPQDMIESVGKDGQYRCDRCGGEQVRLRGKVGIDGTDPVTGESYFDLWVVYNLCCEKVVTAFYADRPTPIRTDQGIDRYRWTHPDYGFTMWVTAFTWENLHAELAAAVEEHLSGIAPRKTQQQQRPPHLQHNPNPKHNRSYYKKKKKQKKGV